MRKCLGCMESKPKDQLLRISFSEGKIGLDLNGTADGRGAYLCPDAGCFEKAEKKRAFNRAFRSGIDQESIQVTRREFSEYIRRCK